ncbi:MAG: tetratricopeptide repeat protein [Rhodospirillales bacterium]|nr:tetratricopeptide repeat protein [Rhodospirillales bacterium]
MTISSLGPESLRPKAPGRLKRMAAIAVVAAGLSACTLGDARGEAQDRVDAEAITLGESWTGNFLAAGHAQARRDYAASADLLLAAAEEGSADRALLQRTHFVLVMDGRVEDAARIARQLGEVGHDGPLPVLTLAAEALRSGRPAEAEAQLQKLPTASVHGILRPVMMAWTLHELGRTQDALTALEPLEESERTEGLYHLHAALLNAANGNVDAAAEHYRTATPEEGALSLRVVQLAGAFYERTGRAEEAASLYRRYQQEQPGSELLTPALERLAAGEAPPPPMTTAVEGAAEALFSVASSLSRQSADESGLALARIGLYLRPDFPALQVLTAQILEGFGRFEDANHAYRQVDPSASLAWHARLGIAGNLARLDRPEEAEALLREMSAERPDDPQPLIELGDIQRRGESFEEAAKSYDAAFKRIPEVGPQHWGILYARGIAFERSGQWDRAEADFLKALEFQPDQPLVLNYLGYSWVEQGRHLERALGMIEKAVSLRPEDGYIVDSLGWAHYRLGNFEQAITHLEQAVELQPGDPTINDHLGDAYWQVGRQREARFQWRAALALDPEPDARAEIEEKLKRGPVREANAATK